MHRPRMLSVWAFLWPIAALAAFASLQTWRIVVLDRLRTGDDAAPSAYLELGPWIRQAQVANPRALTSFYPLPALLRIHKDQPILLVQLAGWAITMAIAGWLAALLLSTLASFTARRLPRSMMIRHRLRITSYALAMSTPWGLLFAPLVGAASWFAGFDRSGLGRPVVDAVVPTAIQTGSMVLAWSVLMAVASRLLLGRAAAIGGPRCLRCAYPREGVVGDHCPECGLPFETIAAIAPSARASHTAVAKLTGGLVVVLATCLTTGALWSPTARDWLRLRPQWSARQSLELAFAWLGPGSTPSQEIQCRYGTIRLRASHRSVTAEAPEHSWQVDWNFTPDPSSPIAASSGSAIVSALPTTETRVVITPVKFPFGDASFVLISDMPDTLIIQGNQLIYKPSPSPSGVHWGFPRPR